MDMTSITQFVNFGEIQKLIIPEQFFAENYKTNHNICYSLKKLSLYFN